MPRTDGAPGMWGRACSRGGFHDTARPRLLLLGVTGYASMWPIRGQETLTSTGGETQKGEAGVLCASVLQPAFPLSDLRVSREMA